MRNPIRRFLAPLVGALALMLASASTAIAAVELTMYYPVAVGGPLTKIVDGMVANFEKEHPDIKVKAIYAGNYNDARIKALAALKSGKPAQLSVMFSIDIYELIEQDAIVAFDDIVETGDNNFPLDTDNDGEYDFRDADNDNDGIADIVEIGSDTSNPLDLDGDGIADHLDADSLGIGDINEDGKRTVADVLLLQKALSDHLTLSATQTLQANTYPIGGAALIDISDLLVLQQIMTQ